MAYNPLGKQNYIALKATRDRLARQVQRLEEELVFYRLWDANRVPGWYLAIQTDRPPHSRLFGPFPSQQHAQEYLANELAEIDGDYYSFGYMFYGDDNDRSKPPEPT